METPKQYIDFKFPIDPKWSEQELFEKVYQKVQNYPELYLKDSVLNQFKRVKRKTLNDLLLRYATFFSDVGWDDRPQPVIYLIVQFINYTYKVVLPTRNLREDEILIFRFMCVKNPPENTSQFVFHDFVQPRLSLPLFLK